MSSAARKVIDDAMALSEEDRLEIATELIASVDGSADSGWDDVWTAELDRRSEAASARGEPASEWAEVRSRILRGLVSP